MFISQLCGVFDDRMAHNGGQRKYAKSGRNNYERIIKQCTSRDRRRLKSSTYDMLLEVCILVAVLDYDEIGILVAWQSMLLLSASAWLPRPCPRLQTGTE